MAEQTCPECGAPLPAELGQHALTPTSGLVQCPSCGAQVTLERPAEAGAGDEPDVEGEGTRLLRGRGDGRGRHGRDRAEGGVVSVAEERAVRPLTVSVNGRARTAEVEPRLLLVHFLREQRLTGTHVGCDTTSCGACTVLLDGSRSSPAPSSPSRPRARDRHRRGPGAERRAPPGAGGFREEHGLQCGFCTPGMMLTAKALLESNPTRASRRSAGRCGNLCRCTGYQNIVKAVQCAAKKMREGAGMTATETEGKGSLGKNVKRVEDDRFIRGKGNYVDDIALPGMLHMAILRSPFAHAKIN